MALFVILTSCSRNDEPDLPIFMQPSSIVTDDAKGDNQSFTYDDYGRIVSWSLKSNSTNDATSYIAHYSYSNDDAIIFHQKKISMGIRDA